MIGIDLTTAIGEIRTAYEGLSPNRSPFFFVMGAGVSAPSVPLSEAIIEHCRQKACARGVNYESTEKLSVIGNYSVWFDRAYPQPIDRQRYLRSLIEKKPITDANLRLAHILLSRKISNLVITPNFDDLLSRSLSIFGAHHIVSDHPHTVDRIDLEGDDIQIVHVHGSYLFYDCSNLQEELEFRARPSATSTKTMSAFLDRALSFRSPIVVGYAGWESDVIMASLKRRLEGNNLPYRIYWCCYQMKDVELLPTWLINHNDVRIVLATPIRESLRGRSSSANDATGPDDRGITAESDKILPARVVFEELIRSFELEEPELTRDPILFFSKQLSESIYLGSGSDETVYFFSDVITRVERAAELERQDRNAEPTAATLVSRDVQSQLALVKDAIRRSRYDNAIKTAASLNLDRLSKEECLELFEAFETVGSNERSEQTIAMVDFLVELGRRLTAAGDAESLRRFYVEPQIEKAEALRDLGKPEDSIEVLDEMIRHVPSNLVPQLQESILYASTRKALALGELGRMEEEVKLYAQIITDLEALDTSFSRWLLSQSRYNYAVDLAQLGRTQEAIIAYDFYIRSYRGAEDAWTQVLVAAALRGKARLLRNSGRASEALNTLNEVLNLYEGSTHPQVSSVVDGVLALKADLLTLGQSEEAEKIHIEITRRIKAQEGSTRELAKTPDLQTPSRASSQASSSKAKVKKRVTPKTVRTKILRPKNRD